MSGSGTDDGAAALLPGEPRSFASGRYAVRRRLGAGNFATVYLAYDERLDVFVAVKLLSDRWSWEPEVRGRFVQEARILRSLNSPHVVQIRDIAETEDGRPYLVMDYADRGTLEQRLVDLAQRQLRPGVAELRRVAAALADALAFIHDRRIAHRDIKPSNVLITADDGGAATSAPGGALLRHGERIMLGDLGLAKNLALDSGVTVGVGTAGYMAPEQAVGGSKIDTRTDVFAVSALLSQVASGEAPDPVRRYSGGEVTSGRPLSPLVPRPLAQVLARGLDTDPDSRPQTIREWHAEVDAALGAVSAEPPASPAPRTEAAASVPAAPPPPRTADGRRGRRTAVVVAALVALAVAAVVGFVALDDTTDVASTVGTSAVTDAVGTAETDDTAATLAPTPTALPTSVAAAFVEITGPVTVRSGEPVTWGVDHAGVVSGTWSLTGPVQPDPDDWLPGDGFSGTWNVTGTFRLTLTAVDATGNRVQDTLTFRVADAA